MKKIIFPLLILSLSVFSCLGEEETQSQKGSIEGLNSPHEPGEGEHDPEEDCEHDAQEPCGGCEPGTVCEVFVYDTCEGVEEPGGIFPEDMECGLEEIYECVPEDDNLDPCGSCEPGTVCEVFVYDTCESLDEPGGIFPEDMECDLEEIYECVPQDDNLDPCGSCEPGTVCEAFVYDTCADPEDFPGGIIPEDMECGLEEIYECVPQDDNLDPCRSCEPGTICEAFVYDTCEGFEELPGDIFPEECGLEEIYECVPAGDNLDPCGSCEPGTLCSSTVVDTCEDFPADIIPEDIECGLEDVYECVLIDELFPI